MGAEIYMACNGVEGVEMFCESEENFYDIILMDIQMPIMNRYTAAKSIRESKRKDADVIPIVAYAFAEDITEAKKAEMNGYLAKPLDLEMLKREIKKYL